MHSSAMEIANAEPSTHVEFTRNPPPPKRFRAVWLLFASLLTTAVTVTLAILEWVPEKPIGVVGFGASAILAAAGAISAIASIASGFRTLTLAHILLLVVTFLSNGFMALFGAMLTVLSLGDFRRGRQIHRFGRVLLPPLQAKTQWVSGDTQVRIPDDARAGLAAQWRENGRTEHASVAAFAHLTLDLMALGAPPELVIAAQCDALDEIRHAQLCFSLARAMDGHDVGPGPFAVHQRNLTPRASRPLELAKLAVDSLVDGALHEGVSARVIAQLAKRAEHAEIRAVLKELAADEGKHAAHGWDVVDWCVREGGKPVIEAVEGAIRALPATLHSPLPLPAQEGDWESYGIHGHALEAAEYEKARKDILRRVAKMGRPEAA